MTREGQEPTDSEPTDPWRSDDDGETVITPPPAKSTDAGAKQPLKGRAAVHQKTSQLPIVDEYDDEFPRRRRGMGGRWADRWRRRLVAAVIAVVVILGVCLGLRALDLIPAFKNPFATEVTDRSQPVLLVSIRDLKRFVGAEGNFQVVIDLQENKRFIPDILFNERTLFVGAGTVEAYVDFSNLNESAIVTSPDGKQITITLPNPELGKPNIDNQNSRVFAQERGLFNRVGDLFGNDPNQLQQMYRLAEDKIGTAAKDSELDKRAAANTEAMLKSLLHSLGYEVVIVCWGGVCPGGVSAPAGTPTP